MRSPLASPFTEDQIQRVMLANEIDAMLQTRAWRFVEDRWTAMIDEARTLALRADTSGAQGLDVVRRWQLTDELVSTLRAEITSRLEERDEILKNPEDLMATVLQEQLNARHGNPRTDESTDFTGTSAGH